MYLARSGWQPAGDVDHRCCVRGLRPLLVTLAVMGEPSSSTFTRAGLITMAVSLALVSWAYWRRRGVADHVLMLAGVLSPFSSLRNSPLTLAEMLMFMTSEGQGAGSEP